MELIQISDSYKETAGTFLKSSKLASVLEKYGRIEFEGAYAGNVMLHAWHKYTMPRKSVM
jgi:hypothetical protein